MPKKRILIVDDKEKLCRLMSTNYQQQGYETDYATCGDDAINKFKEGEFHIVLLDLKLGADNGLNVLKELLAINPKIPVIMITGFGTISTAVEAMKIGAFDYVQKPVDFPAICKIIKKALKQSPEPTEVDDTPIVSTEFHTKNTDFKNIIENLDKFSPTDMPILISGESGVGKEHLADYIQQHSLRSNEEYLKINCSSFSESLLTNELFGHEKGSYTGAEKTHPGIFEQAHKGTLFLDEIGDMPLSVQVRILRTIQSSEIRRIGGRHIFNVNIRIIAASNKNLTDLIEKKLFRLDLYYRLNSVSVTIPPLRERTEDLPHLCDFILHKIARKNQCSIKKISNEVTALFLKYPFPGNIRELENILNYAYTMANTDTITVSDLPPFLHNPQQETNTLNSDILKLNEKDTITQVLHDCNFNKKRASQLLGISRSTLYSKLEKYGII